MARKRREINEVIDKKKRLKLKFSIMMFRPLAATTED